MDNPEEVLHILDEFGKLKPKDIPKELEDYLSYVARTGDPVYQWSLVKCLFREKLLRVITDFYESSTLINPPSPAVDNFNYEAMKRVLLERLETFSNAPFTVQRLCELLTAPRKQYNRTDKFMRAIEKNILVVSTREPGSACRQDNALTEPLPNGVSDGESMAQSVKNESSVEAQINESEDSALTDDCHVDIGSVEPESCVAAFVPKDLEPIKLQLSDDLSNNVEEPSTANLDDDTCKAAANSEPIEAHPTELVENSEPSDKSDLVVHSLECVESTDPTEPQEELSVQLVEQEEVKSETELIKSVKEEPVLDTNEVVSESKSGNANVKQVNDSSEAVIKPIAEEPDVSCSTSDTTNWSNPLPEEHDGVSTTEALPVASSSNLEQDAVGPVEAVEATSSEDSKVIPESSETSEVVTENPSESIETFKDIGSSSDPLISTKSETREEDDVGTTDKAPDEEPVAGSFEENPSKSPETEETNQPEESSIIPPEAEESAVAETSISEANVAEETAEIPIVITEDTSKDSKSAEVSSASEICSKEEAKEALPAVPEEAMDIDEANSCHSTAAVTETEEMTVADQSEPMDDSE